MFDNMTVEELIQVIDKIERITYWKHIEIDIDMVREYLKKCPQNSKAFKVLDGVDIENWFENMYQRNKLEKYPKGD